MTILLHGSNSTTKGHSFHKLHSLSKRHTSNLNSSDLCKHFFSYLQSIKYHKHTQETKNALGIRCIKNLVYEVITVIFSTASDITQLQHSHLALRK